MSKYKIGKVYKIIYIGNENVNITYIGSTFNTLRDRFYHHKNSFNAKNKKNIVSIYPYFEKYGIKNFKIILIKEYKVCDKLHLESKEQLYINKIKNINKQCSFQLSSKLWMKNYYKDNKDKIKEKSKNRYESNKEEILNRQKIISLKYREKNDKILKEIIKCECGKTLTKQSLKLHLTSNKHLNYINNINNIKKNHNDKIICECGIVYSRGNKNQHIKTKKHLNFINPLTEL